MKQKQTQQKLVIEKIDVTTLLYTYFRKAMLTPQKIGKSKITIHAWT